MKKQRNGWNGMKFFMRSLKMIDQVCTYIGTLCALHGKPPHQTQFTSINLEGFLFFAEAIYSILKRMHRAARIPDDDAEALQIGANRWKGSHVFSAFRCFTPLVPGDPWGWLFNSMRVRWIKKKHICFFPRLVKLFDRSARSLWSETQPFPAWRFAAVTIWKWRFLMTRFQTTNKYMATGGNCTGSRVPEKIMHSKSGELQSDQMFPMVTVPLDTLLKMTEMHTHEKLMETWRLGFVWLQGSATSKHPWEPSEQRENFRASKQKVEVEKWIITSHGILNHNHHIYAREKLMSCPNGGIIGLLSFISHYPPWN